MQIEFDIPYFCPKDCMFFEPEVDFLSDNEGGRIVLRHCANRRVCENAVSAYKTVMLSKLKETGKCQN